VRSKCLIIVAIMQVLFAGSAQAAGSQSGHSSQSQSLLRQMDTDRNGTVSKTEFLQFMSRRFNRLDKNHNGKLERNELRTPIGGR
jgi:Ca2+-binding EF-hand superfamily protein